VSSSSFTEGARNAGGQRYVTFTFRVRNGTGSPLDNLTFLMVSKAGTLNGSAVSSLKRFDGTDASASIAPLVIPSGAVALGRDLETMEPLYADVIQAFTEPEVAAITPPGDVTGIFPYGLVVRNARSQSTRLLPATSDANQFDGAMTLSFRLPLQATGAQDVFSLFFQVLAVTDSERRMTESVEEQTLEGHAQIVAAASALGATTVTVLNGSPSTGYAGQRQICGLRVAGPAGTPTSTVVSPGAYTRLAAYQPGETVDACLANFRAGNPNRIGVNISTGFTVRAMDRYGNTLSGVVDTVALTSNDPVYGGGFRGALTSGVRTIFHSFSAYGAYSVSLVGRRVRGARSFSAVPITRTWNGNSSTSWNSSINWDVGSSPSTQDTVIIPAGRPNAPVLVSSVTIGPLRVADATTVSLGTYTLTSGGTVTTGQTSGGIIGTTGRLVLAGGLGSTVAGRLPEVQVRGSYSLSGPLLLKSPAQVDLGGGLESVGWLTEIKHY
jgi:hypothetical protein